MLYLPGIVGNVYVITSDDALVHWGSHGQSGKKSEDEQHGYQWDESNEVELAYL